MSLKESLEDGNVGAVRLNLDGQPQMLGLTLQDSLVGRVW